MIDLRIRTLPLFDLDENPPEVPTIATVREIDINVTNNKIYFYFSRGTFRVDLGTYNRGLSGLLQDVRTGSYIYADNVSNIPDPPCSPLSLNNQHLTYVIYRLSNKNWQFCEDHPPFSIGLEGKGAGVYFKARRIGPTGNEELVDIETRLPVTKKSMVAYFIADGRKALGFTGTYLHAINIHVDLLYEEMANARIPLVIDPDVRHPGGSGE